jgi:glycyl-tRNA synthetase beta chain
MTAATLLVELLTEELPPKSLAKLGNTFAEEVRRGLADSHLLSTKSAVRVFATPRRLAVSISEVLGHGPDRTQTEKIMPISVALDASGNPSAALKKKLAAKKIAETEIQFFTKKMDGKSETFFYELNVIGEKLAISLPIIVESVLKRLPVAKMMRWGDGDAEFVRPVHGLVMLHGKSVVPGTVLGIASGNTTRGHRFMGEAALTIADAESYESILETSGKVVADFAKRRTTIDGLLQAEAKKQQGTLGSYADLLDEVTALVEHPSVYVGAFDAGFLEVPQECLILTMRQNQKYFPLFDNNGKLTHRFLIVSNMQVADPINIISGNQRVVRPRLEDARFFYNQDRKERLETRVPRLGKVVYHNKLGSQLERIERVQLLAGKIARALDTDAAAAERAAWLAKADLVTGMVGEFPELQGIMGRYYALHDGEPAAVADAIAAHYQPRFAGDRLPDSRMSCAVALADKLETLAGLFGIGQLPTGDRDPFALRRHALGVIRILIERDLPLSLKELIDDAFAVFPKDLKLADGHTDLESFVFERMRGYFADAGYTTQEIDAVLSLRPFIVHKIPLQLAAVRAFAGLPEAASLAAANKRVANILRQAETKGEAGRGAEAKLLQEPAERALFDALKQASAAATPLFQQGDYTGYLKTFAVLKAPVDAFFDGVMVMADDAALRRNRIALLGDLQLEMNRIADIAKLAA